MFTEMAGRNSVCAEDRRCGEKVKQRRCTWVTIPATEIKGRMITYCRTAYLTEYMKYGFVGRYLKQQN